MTRLDNFLDALAACFLVTVLAAVAVVVVKLGIYLPLGILGPVMIFLAGVAIGSLVMFYVVGSMKDKDVTQ